MNEISTETELHVTNNESGDEIPHSSPFLLPNVVSHIFLSSKQPIEVLVTDIEGKDIEYIFSLKFNFKLEEK